jgi:hypothetical protein
VENGEGELTSRRCKFERHNVMWDINLARPLGARAIVLIHKNRRKGQRTWTQRKTWKGMFLGYYPVSEESYRIWKPDEEVVKKVPYELTTILENDFPWKKR